MNWHIAAWPIGARGAARVAQELGAKKTSVVGVQNAPMAEGDWIVYVSGREDLKEIERGAKRLGKRGRVKAILADFDDKAQLVRFGGLTEKVGWSKAPVVFDIRALKQELKIPAGSNPTLGKWLMEFRSRYGLTQTDVARCLNVALRTVQNWEAGLGLKAAAKKSKDLRELDEILTELMKGEDIADWLHLPLKAHDGRSAYQLMTNGQVRDLVIGLARALDGVS